MADDAAFRPEDDVTHPRWGRYALLRCRRLLHVAPHSARIDPEHAAPLERLGGPPASTPHMPGDVPANPDKLRGMVRDPGLRT